MFSVSYLLTTCRVAGRTGSSQFHIGGCYTAPAHQGAIELLTHIHTIPHRVDHWVSLHSCQEFTQLLKGTFGVDAAPPPLFGASVAPLADVLSAFMWLLLREACLLLTQLHLA